MSVYFCPQSETTSYSILEHSVSKHPTELLKYKKLILCETESSIKQTQK